MAVFTNDGVLAGLKILHFRGLTVLVGSVNEKGFFTNFVHKELLGTKRVKIVVT